MVVKHSAEEVDSLEGISEERLIVGYTVVLPATKR